MDFDELKVKLNRPDIEEKNFHRHENGGGWVENTATVGIETSVGPDAAVTGKAHVSWSQVEDNTLISDKARVTSSHISGNARISDEAYVSNSHISGNAHVKDKAKLNPFRDQITGDGKIHVSDNAVVGGHTLITGDVHIGGDTKIIGKTVSDLPTLLKNHEDVTAFLKETENAATTVVKEEKSLLSRIPGGKWTAGGIAAAAAIAGGWALYEHGRKEENAPGQEAGAKR